MKLETKKLIGPAARAVIDIIDTTVNARPEVLAVLRHGRAFLLAGPTGAGKTAAAINAAAELTGGNDHDYMNYTGADIDKPEVLNIARKVSYSPFSGHYVVSHIDEIDEIPPGAQVRLMNVLDNLPKSSVIIATCNDPSRLDARFQRRFTFLPVTAPAPAEICQHLSSIGFSPAASQWASENCDGDTARAILDAEQYDRNTTK